MFLGTGFETKSRVGNGEVNRYNVFNDGIHLFQVMTKKSCRIETIDKSFGLMKHLGFFQTLILIIRIKYHTFLCIDPENTERNERTHVIL